MKKAIVILALLSGAAFGQTVVNGSRKYLGDVDLSTARTFKPPLLGSVPTGSCSDDNAVVKVGIQFFICDPSTHTWAASAGAATGGDLAVYYTDATHVKVSCTPGNCGVRVGNYTTRSSTFPSSVAATCPVSCTAGTTVYFGWDLTTTPATAVMGYDGSTGVQLSGGSGVTYRNTVTSWDNFDANGGGNVFPVWTWTMTTPGQFDSAGGTDQRMLSFYQRLIAGAGVSITYANGAATINATGGGGGSGTVSSSNIGRNAIYPSTGTTVSGSASELDCSAFPGSNPADKIKACLEEAATINSQGMVLNARAVPKTPSWSYNPFTAASALPTSGILQVSAGQIKTCVPIVPPSFWTIEGMQRSFSTQSGTSFLADSACFHAWASPDAGTITTVTANSVSGVTVTGSGTSFSSDMLGCAIIAGSSITTGVTSLAGIISTVTDSTHVVVNFNMKGGTVTGGSLAYAVTCPVFAFGGGTKNSGYQFSIKLKNIDADCGNIAGCIPYLNWFGNENTSMDVFGAHGFSNIGLLVEGPYAQNSGPWTNFSISAGSSCLAGTLNYVSRVSGGSVRGIHDGTSAAPSAGCVGGMQAINMVVDSPGEHADEIHIEFADVGIQIGGISGANVACPIACAQSHINAHAVHVSGINSGGTPAGTTVVRIGSGQDNVHASRLFYNTGYTNTLVDSSNGGCAVTDIYLNDYTIDDNGVTKHSTASTGCLEPSAKTAPIVNITPGATAANTTETDLQSVTISANSMTTNGDYVEIVAAGTSLTALNNIKLKFSGTAICNTNVGAQSWSLSAKVYRTGTTTAVATCMITFGNAAGSPYTAITGLDFTSAVIVKTTGTNASALANDIISKVLSVEPKNW